MRNPDLLIGKTAYARLCGAAYIFFPELNKLINTEHNSIIIIYSSYKYTSSLLYHFYKEICKFHQHVCILILNAWLSTMFSTIFIVLQASMHFTGLYCQI